MEYAFSGRINTELTSAGLDKAIRREKPANGLIFHSNRGSPHAAAAYCERLNASGITPSMSRKGDPYDIAVAENFFSCLKCELVHQSHYVTCAAVECAILSYVEAFCVHTPP